MTSLSSTYKRRDKKIQPGFVNQVEKKTTSYNLVDYFHLPVYNYLQSKSHTHTHLFQLQLKGPVALRHDAGPGVQDHTEVRLS